MAEESRTILPYGRHSVDEADIEAVSEVLRGDWLTTGPAVDRFESALCAATGAAEAAVVSSGTAALHCAYYAAGVGPGSEVVVPPLTFVATASAALHLGAQVRFADVDPATGLLDAAAAAAAIGPATRVVVPVDYCGHPVDGARFEALAAERGVGLIVDAAHSLGAQRAGRRTGEVGDASTLSFHPVKPITTAEGGAVLTAHAEWAARARRFRNHGIEREPAHHREKGGRWHYEICELGLNYRLPDVLCALGLRQLERLEEFVARRRALAARYQEGLADVASLERPVVEADSEPGWHLYVVRVRDAARRGAFFDALQAAGLGVQVHYEAIHLHPFFRDRGHGPGDFPAAEDFAARAVSLPIYPALRDEDLDRVIETVRGVAKQVL